MRKWRCWLRIEQKGERNLEHVGDLDRIRRDRDRRLDPADDRRDGESGDRLVPRQPPSTVTRSGGKPTSSWASRSAAASIDASSGSTRPPGKLIWPGWSGNGRSAASAAWSAPGPVDQRHQHRRRRDERLAAGNRHPSDSRADDGIGCDSRSISHARWASGERSNNGNASGIAKGKGKANRRVVRRRTGLSQLALGGWPARCTSIIGTCRAPP